MGNSLQAAALTGLWLLLSLLVSGSRLMYLGLADAAAVTDNNRAPIIRLCITKVSIIHLSVLYIPKKYLKALNLASLGRLSIFIP